MRREAGFSRVLIANRGAILARIGRTLKRMGIESVAVHSPADRFTAPVLAADHAVALAGNAASESYLDVGAIVAACRASGAEAVHPGYGFLAERADFAEALADAGIVFIGPRPEQMRAFGLKHTARALARDAGVPLLPGSGLLGSVEDAAEAAAEIGYPVMLKSTAGGGGIGMAPCADEAELRARFAGISRLAQANFGEAALYLEKFVTAARHVEVQIFGDGAGGVIALGARDCSLQRRNQKVVEETPPPGIPAPVLAAIEDAACGLARSVRYLSAGTVEFIYDAAAQTFYFLEVNTRLQVEHGVTEEVFGIDLVEWMIRAAAGGFALPAGLTPRGAAVQARLYAEDPAEGFRPSTGRITALRYGAGARVDGWIAPGSEVTPFYDPMLAKLIGRGADRAAAIAALRAALAATVVTGIETNRAYLLAALDDADFRAGTMTTATLGRLDWRGEGIAVLEPGAQSSLQSLPGRLGAGEVGIPPSWPMDARSAARANALLGNPPGTSVLECTLSGPVLRFRGDAEIALAGARMVATLDGARVPHDAVVAVRAGQVLALGAIEGPGQRCYLAVGGGFMAAEFLGSTATFALGGFGGHGTGCLNAGDVLHLAGLARGEAPVPEAAELTARWEIALRYGPHGAPDFFTEADIETLFSASYEVHHNSARTGVRLVGPKPEWARADGGEAGLHPSNIHDVPYAVGAVDFTGDMPILLGPDGPSLGGFVCPGVVRAEDLWKLGQVRPGDVVHFTRADGDPAVLHRSETMVVRRQGDANLLVEFGAMTLDFALRLRAHALQAALRLAGLAGIVDLTPGIRSLQVHFDPDAVRARVLLEAIRAIEPDLPDPAAMTVPSRIVHLPLSWKDGQVMLAMRKYQETVRPDAPWCPDNVEFIRRINGLESEDAVRRIVFDADYLVMGLGDVYLGAPVATPIDPRHRLVTTKYNPARTWTPENAVGIGGAYLCVYGMEGPGGYQLFGRTVQMWNSHPGGRAPFGDTPWLLRHFDVLRFYPVDARDLAEARAAFPHGRYPLRIEETTFSLAAQQALMAAEAESIAAFRARQGAAFAAEREAWRAMGLDAAPAEDLTPPPAATALAAGMRALPAPVPGSVWQVLRGTGERVAAGETVMIVESMKMEVRVTAPAAGVLAAIETAPGQVVRAGQRLAVIAPEDAA